MNINEVLFGGRAGADADDKTTTSGIRIVTLSICHNQKGKDGRPDTATWIRAKAFGGWCSYAATVRKGDRVVIKGPLTISPWEDKEGVKHTEVAVIIHNMAILDRGRETTQNAPVQPTVVSGILDPTHNSIDDIPF